MGYLWWEGERRKCTILVVLLSDHVALIVSLYMMLSYLGIGLEWVNLVDMFSISLRLALHTHIWINNLSQSHGHSILWEIRGFSFRHPGRDGDCIFRIERFSDFLKSSPRKEYLGPFIKSQCSWCVLALGSKRSHHHRHVSEGDTSAEWTPWQFEAWCTLFFLTHDKLKSHLGGNFSCCCNY